MIRNTGRFGFDVIYLDFGTAFDIVNHCRLICKLRNIKVGAQLD